MATVTLKYDTVQLLQESYEKLAKVVRNIVHNIVILWAGPTFVRTENFSKMFGAFYVVVHPCSNFSLCWQMAPLRSIKFQTADFPIFCARIIVIFCTTCIAREVFSVVIIGNEKHVLPVLHCLKRGIAFVSSYYSFMSRSTCTPLYPATDGQQTGNNFVDGNKQHVAGNMLPWCKRGLRFSCANLSLCSTCDQTFTLSACMSVFSIFVTVLNVLSLSASVCL